MSYNLAIYIAQCVSETSAPRNQRGPHSHHRPTTVRVALTSSPPYSHRLHLRQRLHLRHSPTTLPTRASPQQHHHHPSSPSHPHLTDPTEHQDPLHHTPHTHSPLTTLSMHTTLLDKRPNKQSTINRKRKGVSFN